MDPFDTVSTEELCKKNFMSAAWQNQFFYFFILIDSTESTLLADVAQWLPFLSVRHPVRGKLSAHAWAVSLLDI